MLTVYSLLTGSKAESQGRLIYYEKSKRAVSKLWKQLPSKTAAIDKNIQEISSDKGWWKPREGGDFGHLQ